MIVDAKKGAPSAEIGRIGENNARQMRFYVGDVLEEHPDAIFNLLNKRPKDTVAYPVASANIRIEEGYLYWTLQSADMAQKGNGKCQLIVLDGETIVKSTIYNTFIGDALDGSGTPPEPWVSWVEEVLEAAEEAKDAAAMLENCSAEAETLPPGTPATASYEDGVFHFGIPNGDPSAIINDEAGEGVTGQTWSANKLIGQFGGKADKADTVLDTTLSGGRKSGTTVGSGSVAFGQNVEASGSYSQAFGVDSKATNLACHADGFNTTASGYQGDHAEGFGTTASGGQGAHAEGYMTIASGMRGSHAEGNQTQALGGGSHAEGLKTIAYGSYSHAEGRETKAVSVGCHAGGYFNVEEKTIEEWDEFSRANSYNVGERVKVTSGTAPSETVKGYECITPVTPGYSFNPSKWKVISSIADFLEIIGNGTSNSKSNARQLDKYGNERLMGDVYVGCNADSSGGSKLAKVSEIIPATEKGSANGVASLDAGGKVPASQLPSYVDDIVNGYYDDGHFYEDSQHTTEITGEDGKIYVDLPTNTTWRWSGEAFVQIKGDLALGETSDTAYRGDRGKMAYDHASDANRITTAQMSGLYKIAVTGEGHVQSVTPVEKNDITALGIPGQDSLSAGYYSSYTRNAMGNQVNYVLTIKFTDYRLRENNAFMVVFPQNFATSGDTSSNYVTISLNINSTGAKTTYINGVSGGLGYAVSISAGVYWVYYDGTYYYLRKDGLSTPKINGKAVGNAIAKDVDTSVSEGSTSTNLPTSQAVATLVSTKASKDTATQSADGLMSSTDKTKLDGIDIATTAETQAIIDEYGVSA